MRNLHSPGPVCWRELVNDLMEFIDVSTPSVTTKAMDGFIDALIDLDWSEPFDPKAFTDVLRFSAAGLA